MPDGGDGQRPEDTRQHWDMTMRKGFGPWSPLQPSPNDQMDLNAILSDTKTQRPSTADEVKATKRKHIVELLASGTPKASPRIVGQAAMPSPTSIGVALGSPSHSPWAKPSNQRPSLDSSGPASGTQSPFGLTDPSVPQRKKSIFNSIFGRKMSNTSMSSAYRDQATQSPSTPATAWQPPQQPRRVEEGTWTTITAAPATTPRWNDINRRPSVGGVLRKTSRGVRPRQQKPTATPTESRTKAIVSPLGSPDPSPTPSPLISPTTISPIPRIPPESPFIDMAFPNVAMERYSVMFSDVLKPRTPLLARRQTQLKELQLGGDSGGNVLDVITQSPDLLPVRRATNPAPRSPRVALNSNDNAILSSSSEITISEQRTGLSRSNTLPSPMRQDSMRTTKHTLPRKQATLDETFSPSYRSDASISPPHSEWPSSSSGSIDISEISEVSDDNPFEDIIIQLEDLSMPHGLNIQHYPPPFANASSIAMSKKPETPLDTLLYQPNLPIDKKPRNVTTEEVKHSPRTSSRAKFAAGNQTQSHVQTNHPSTLKSHTTALQPQVQAHQPPAPPPVQSQPQYQATAPTPPQKPAPTIRSLPSNPASTKSSTTAPTTAPTIRTPTTTKTTQRQAPPFNPLQSSPASPVEITLARQLSQSRSRGNGKLAPPTSAHMAGNMPANLSPGPASAGAGTEAFSPMTPEPTTPAIAQVLARQPLWRAPLPSHFRNKSEYVVVESV